MSANPVVNEETLNAMMTQINQGCISSNDIIPRSLMPTLSQADIPRRRAEFGDKNLNLYLAHLDFSRRIKETLTSAINQRESTSRMVTLALSMYKMGISESQGLTTMMYTELLKLRFSDFKTVMVYNFENQKGHSLLLINACSLKVNDSFVGKFTSLPDSVLAVDCLLGYVGPANQYIARNKAYFDRFNYTIVVAVEPAKLEHLAFVPNVEERTDAYVEMLRQRGIFPFMSKNLLSLARTGYPCHHAHVIETAEAITALRNYLPDLSCFAIQHPNRDIDVVCEADSRLAVIQTSALGQRLSTGRFYANDQQARFFVIPKVNSEELSAKLASLGATA